MAAARDLQDYKQLGPTYREFKPYQEAVESAKPARGDFTFRSLARNARPGSRTEGLAQDATEVLEDETPGRSDPASRHALYTLGGLAGLSLWGHPGLAAAGWAVPYALSARGAHRVLYGDTSAQRVLATSIRRSPQVTYSLGLAGRQALNASQQR